MAHRRYRIDIALPIPLPAALSQKPTPAQLTALGDMTWLQIVKEIVNRLQTYAENINEGAQNAEQTKVGKMHVCRHAEGQPCDEEEDI